MTHMRRGPLASQALIIFLAAYALPLILDAQTTEPLAYRRVFVAESLLQGQIRGLLPLQRAEFERRSKLATIASSEAAGIAPAHIENAVYRAKLVERQLISGTAALSISARDGQATLLSLEPSDLALESARWMADEARSAILGRDQTGKLQCLVERSGSLGLTWSLAAQATSGDEAVFLLRLPPATRRRIEILAPRSQELSASSGIVTRGGLSAEHADERLWTIELTGEPEIRLTARAAAKDEKTGPLMVVRESSSYSLLPATFDLESTFTVDLLERSLAELRLRVDSSLQVTRVRVADRDLTFRSTSSAESGEPTLVTCDLPQAIQGYQHIVEVEATGSWPIAHRWTLPRIQIAGGLLQQGTWRLNAPDWLRLTPRPLRGCVQTQAAPASAARTDDRFEFRVFAADAAVEVAADESALPLQEQSGTQITVEPNQVQGVLIAELKSAIGDQYVVEALVPRQWIVDAVETIPAEVLADRAISARGAGPQLLQLKLAQPITARRPLRVIVRAHYRRAANGEALDGSGFQVARFPASGEGRRLVAIRINDPGAELRLLGDDHLSRLDPELITPSDRNLFESPPGTLLFETRAEVEGVAATIEPAIPSYRADAFLRAETVQRGSEQSVLIRCQPETTAVGSVVVRMAPRPRGSVSWRLEGEEPRELTAMPEGSRAGGDANDEVVYRLLLPRPTNSGFEIRGTWSAPASGPVSLVWLPEAKRQTAEVEIHSAVGNLDIASREAQPLPRPAASLNGSLRLLARFCYEAGQRAQIAVKQPVAGEVAPAAWIEMLYVTSHFSPAGGADHVARFTVRNAGASQIRVRLAANVTECRLVSDGSETVLRPGLDAGYDVPLNAGSQESVLQLHYSSSGESFGVLPFHRCNAPLPLPNVPVLARKWSVGLPPGFARLAPNAGWPTSHAAEIADETRVEGDSIPSDATSDARWYSRLGLLLAGPQLASHSKWFKRSAGPPAKDPAFRGWTVFSHTLRDGDEATIRVYRPGVLAAWACCVCLAAVPIGQRLARSRRWFVSIVALGGAVAIAMSPPIAWIAGGASLGLVLGGVMSRIGFSTSSAFRPPLLRAVAPAGATAAVVVFVVLGVSRVLLAAPTSAPAAIARVVFPVDEQQQPTGDYVYLEPDFYERLHRLTNDSPITLPAWLLENARYEFSASSRDGPAGAALDVLRIVFDFHTFQPGAAVEFPLRRDQVSLMERRARLDGAPAALTWDAAGKTLSLKAAGAGKHRLELWLAVAAQSKNESLVVDMTIPPAALSSVVLPFPAADGTEVVGATSSRTLDDGSQVFQMSEGNRLAVRWPVRAVGSTALRAVEAEQLLWWKARSASVVLEAQFHLRASGTPIRQVVIDVDPRLRSLASLSTGPIGRIEVEEGPTNRMTIELAEPLDVVRFTLGWLWPDAAGVGTLVFPRVNVRADRQTRSWAALSLDAGLELGADVGVADKIDVHEFARTWSGGGSPPVTAFHTPNPGSPRQVAIRATAQLPQADQEIDWSVSQSSAQANCTIRLTDVPPTCFEHRLSLPAELQVMRLAVTQADRPAAIRWTRQADGLLVVTLLEAPAAVQNIAFDAELTTVGSASELRLPSIEMDSAKRSGSSLRIYRQADVELTVQPVAGWAADNLANVGEHRAMLGRLVAALRCENFESSSQPFIVRRLNRPLVTGKMLIKIDQADGDWRSEVELDLEIARGVLDLIRLTIPDEWSSALEIEPEMPHRLEPAAGEARRLITIYPPRAAAEHIHVRLRGPLDVSTGGAQAPDIELLGGRSVERFVLLDRGSVGQPIDWETTGLVEADAPADPSFATGWQPGSASLFRVIAPQFQAIARSRPSVGKPPQIYLADIRTAFSSAHRFTTTANYLVDPSDASEVAFELPAGCRLIQVLIDGLSARSGQSGLRTWKLAAPSEVLPYELTIVYDSSLPASMESSSPLRVSAPRLSGMRAPSAIWSIGGHSMEVPSASGAATCSRQQAEVLRLEAYVQALESVQAARASSLPTPVLAEAFDRWQRKLEAIARRVNSSSANEAESDDALSPRIQAAHNAAQGVRQRLVQTGVVGEDHTPSREVESGASEPESASRFLVAGENLMLHVAWPRSAVVDPLPRWLLASCLAMAVAAIWPSPHFREARNWLHAHGQFLLALGGIAWWLFAPLGWLGWLVVLWAIWLGFRSPLVRVRSGSASTTYRPAAPGHGV